MKYCLHIYRAILKFQMDLSTSSPSSFLFPKILMLDDTIFWINEGESNLKKPTQTT